MGVIVTSLGDKLQTLIETHTVAFNSLKETPLRQIVNLAGKEPSIYSVAGQLAHHRVLIFPGAKDWYKYW